MVQLRIPKTQIKKPMPLIRNGNHFTSSQQIIPVWRVVCFLVVHVYITVSLMKKYQIVLKFPSNGEGAKKKRRLTIKLINSEVEWLVERGGVILSESCTYLKFIKNIKRNLNRLSALLSYIPQWFYFAISPFSSKTLKFLYHFL